MQWKLVVVLVVAALSAGAAHKITQAFADARYHELEEQIERERNAAIERAIKRHNELTLKLEQVQKDYEKKKADLNADLIDANAVNKRLLQELDKRRAVTVTTVTSCGNAAGRTTDLPSELFARANERAGELAEYADRLTLALGACRDAYNSVKL